MSDKKHQRLYDGDKHGAIEAVLVEDLSGEKYSRVTFWLRSTQHKTEFQCFTTEADAIARRLTTPINDGPPPR